MIDIKTFFIIFTIILFVLLIILIRTKFYEKYFIKTPYLSITTHFDKLKDVCKDKVKYIKDNTGFLRPYNKKIMDVVSQNINNATDLNTLIASFNLLPYNSLGTYPLTPLSNPIDTTCFQLEQGTVGWYWGYLTFPKNKISVMYYILRIDVGTEKLRKKYNLQLGETTAYYVALGLGKDTDWHYTPYKYIRGSYQTFSESAFIFNSVDDDIACQFSGLGPGQFHLNFTWKEGSDTFQVDTDIYSKQKPYFNGDDTGCAPCIAGAGTLYWSYTQLYNKNTKIIFKDITSPINLDNDSGIGWLDRQWTNSIINNNLINCVNNIVQSTKRVGGLGRYIWLNAHLDNEQYMITVMLTDNSKIEKDQILSNAKYNLYSSSLENPLYNQDTKLKILDTTTVDNTVFPTKYQVTVKDINDKEHTYLIDSTPFGNTVTIDLTGNFHWSGSALLFDETNNQVGTAFLEANQFQDYEKYTKNYFNKAKIIGNTEYFTGKSTITFGQAVPSILLLLLYVILIIIWFYILIKYIIKNKTNS